jgi:hypothetical protein
MSMIKSKLASVLAAACVFASSSTALAQDAAAPVAKDVLPSKAGGIVKPGSGILWRPGNLPRPGILPILPGKPLAAPTWPGSLPKPGVTNPTGTKPGVVPRVLPVRPLLDPPGLRPITLPGGVVPVQPTNPLTPTEAGAYDRCQNARCR